MDSSKGPRDLRYRDIYLNPAYLGLADSLKTDLLKPAAFAYERNMKRIGSLVFLMPNVINLCYDNTIASVKASIDTLKESGLEITADLDVPDELERHVFGKYFRRRMLELMGSANDPDHAEKVWESGNDLLDKMMRQVGGFQDPIEAVFSASIVGTWTAFEVLAGDLWIRSGQANGTLLFSAAE